MRQAYRRIPIYTADISGVCSALYELGGMTVMHDPSGCNSTYNTHDELRWYDQDSLIFISALTERDAILGNDSKFCRDVVEAAESLHPEFIALATAPIPWMNGTDFTGLARVIGKKTGIPTFFIATSGMHDYVRGAGMALAAVAERLVDPGKSPRGGRRVNILGMTPLDFGAKSCPGSIRRILTEAGWEVISCWAMGDDLAALRRAGEADVNLVVSSVGLRAARVLQRRFGTPYVTGTFAGAFTPVLLAALEEAARTRGGGTAYLTAGEAAEGETVTIVGEPVTMGSLAAAVRLGTGRPTRVLCPLEEYQGLLRGTDTALVGEEAMERALARAHTLVADPLYRDICPEDIDFRPLPQLAFSGRIFRKQMADLAAWNENENESENANANGNVDGKEEPDGTQ